MQNHYLYRNNIILLLCPVRDNSLVKKRKVQLTSYCTVGTKLSRLYSFQARSVNWVVPICLVVKTGSTQLHSGYIFWLT